MGGIFEIIFFAVAKKTKGPAAIEQIDTMIRTIRGERVMLDSDLASIYGVETKSAFAIRFLFSVSFHQISKIKH
jgi:hypothetical protein